MTTAPPSPAATCPRTSRDRPASIGMAEMLLNDGTIRLHLRTETGRRHDRRSAEGGEEGRSDLSDATLAHVAGLKPGTSQPLAPFPEPEIDPDSI